MRVLSIAATTILATTPGLLAAAEPPCLTKSEFSDLAGYALPSVIGGASDRCKPTLGPDAFLETEGPDLIQRYQGRKAETWPAAKSAFLKLSAKTDSKANHLLSSLPDKTLQDMLDLMLEGLVSQEIPTKTCATIDDVARLLAPLPPENTADLLTLVVDLAGKPKDDGSGKTAFGKLAICQD